MDLIIKIQQKIDTLESGAGDGEAKALQTLLSGLGDEVQSQGEAASIVKMMQSITKYLIGRMDRPHPDALPLLKRLGSNLDTLMGLPSGNTSDAREILDRSIFEFKSLKTAISAPVPISDKEFEELKAVVLSIDWEISSHTLKTFDEVISRLKHKFKFNKVHLTFLRIMHSLGAYISKNGANANSDSIGLIQSVFLNYEKLVRNPDMPTPEKKALIEGDIRKYNEFKEGLVGTKAASVRPQAPAQVPPPVPSQASPDPEDELPPALSHISSSGATDDQATLNLLSDSPELDDDILEVFGSQQGQAEPQRDVMGDLFSPKTTPADELLDAIHLAELHGENQQAPAGMMPSDSSGQEEGEGVKNYVPERSGGAPIPEIESRLDAFFNLDVSESSISSFDPEEDSGPPAEPVAGFPAQYPVDEDDEEEDDEDIEPGLSGLVGLDQDVEPAFGTDDDFEGLNTLFEEEPPAPVLDEEDEEDIAPGLSSLGGPDQGAAPVFDTDDDFEDLNTLSELDPATLSEDEPAAPALDFVSEDETGEIGDELPLERIPEDSIEFIDPEADELETDSLVADLEVDEDADSLIADLKEDDSADALLVGDLEADDSVDSLLADLEMDDPAEPVLARLKNMLNTPTELADDGIYTQALEDIAGLNQIWDTDSDKRVLLDMLSILCHHAHNSGAGRVIAGEKEEEVQDPQASVEDMESTQAEDSDMIPDTESGDIEPFPPAEDLDTPATEEPLTEEPSSEELVTEEQSTEEPLDEELSTEDEKEEEKEAASFDDEFAPEEVEPKPKLGFWGRLTARFRK